METIRSTWRFYTHEKSPFSTSKQHTQEHQQEDKFRSWFILLIAETRFVFSLTHNVIRGLGNVEAKTSVLNPFLFAANKKGIIYFVNQGSSKN